MQCSIIFVVLAIIFGRSLSQHCEVVESQHECGGYCYGAVKPVLDYLAILQKRVESCEAKQPAYTQSKIVRIEEKLDTLTRHMAVQQELEKILRTADTLSKLALMNEKLGTLERQMATKQELEKSSKQSEEALSKIVLVDENVGTLKIQTATQQQLENTLSIIDLVNEKLEALRNQTVALQELEKSSQSRLQRLELFTKIGSKYYYIENKISLNWHDTLKKCREVGAHLVSLQSKDEMEALRGILKRGNVYWTDLNDLETGGEFISTTTGSKGTFIHWSEGQPNNLESPEHCIALEDEKSFSSFGMHDYPCDTNSTLICESSLD